MRAVVYDQFGREPEVRTVEDPVPSRQGAVIRVEATGLCRSDWRGWQGRDAVPIPLPHVPGHELAGTVEAVGAAVTGWRAGDRVTVLFVCACGTCAACAARWRRWRTVRRLLAGSGAAPARAAKAASLRQRPRCDQDRVAWAAVTGPTPWRSSKPGAKRLTSAVSCLWVAANSRSASRIAIANRRASARRTGCSTVSSPLPRRRVVVDRATGIAPFEGLAPDRT
jgi:hypothetical protein